MFARVTIGVSDLLASRRFYAATLGALGIGVTQETGREVVFGDFAISRVLPVTTGLHVGFAAPSREHARRFWHAGVDAGFVSDGEPGPRALYGADYFGAFLLDPDGNSAEAALHANARTTPGIDHLWIRRRDRAPFAELGVPVVTDEPGLTRYRRRRRDGSFTVLEGTPETGPFALELQSA